MVMTRAMSMFLAWPVVKARKIFRTLNFVSQPVRNIGIAVFAGEVAFVGISVFAGIAVFAHLRHY